MSNNDIELIAESAATLEALKASKPIIKPSKLILKNDQKMDLKLLSEAIPTFQPGDNLLTFIKEVDGVLAFCHGKLDEMQTYFLGGIIRNKIRGEARDLVTQTGDDWVTIKAALISQYGDKRNEDLLVAALDQCVQNPTETFADFHRQVVKGLETLMRNVRSNTTDRATLQVKQSIYTALALKVFKLGLCQPYRSHLALFPNDTLNECLTRLETFQNTRAEIEQRELLRKTKFPQKSNNQQPPQKFNPQSNNQKQIFPQFRHNPVNPRNFFLPNIPMQTRPQYQPGQKTNNGFQNPQNPSGQLALPSPYPRQQIHQSPFNRPPPQQQYKPTPMSGVSVRPNSFLRRQPPQNSFHQNLARPGTYYSEELRNMEYVPYHDHDTYRYMDRNECQNPQFPDFYDFNCYPQYYEQEYVDANDIPPDVETQKPPEIEKTTSNEEDGNFRIEASDTPT